MTRLLIVLLVVMTLASASVYAQGPAGIVSVFSDPYGTECNIYDVVPGILQVFVVYNYHSGAEAVQFSAPIPDCFGTAIWLQDLPSYPIVDGNSQSGVRVALGGCMPAPAVVMTIEFFIQGLTAPCCRYPVLADPRLPSGKIEALDCAQNIVYPEGGRGIINPDATCLCTFPVPVEETTWGQIKSLYR
jgi:hypothetical protein